MGTMNLRAVSDDLIKWAKIRAVQRGMLLRDWVMELISNDKRDAEARRGKE